MNEDIGIETKMSLVYKIQTLFLNSKMVIPTNLNINKDNLLFLHSETQSEIFSILFADVIGASISQKNLISVKGIDLLSKVPITINFCPKIQIINSKCCCGKNSNSDTFTRKVKQVQVFIEEEFHNEFLNIINNIALYNKPSKINPTKKKFLAFVNPTSGKGKSFKRWLEAKTLFDLSHVEVDLIKTRYYRHAYDYILSLEEKKYDGIICVSGDGIVHEVINALMHRKDNLKEEITIGTIPAGTGNGLSKTLSEENNENLDSISFAYMICKGQKIKMDLFEIEMISKDKFIYAFHSVSSGLIAEIGIFSEVCKCIGDIRFKLYGFWRFLTLNSKHFYTSMYYPEKEELDERTIDEFPELKKELPDKMTNIKTEIRAMIIQNLRWSTEKLSAPEPTKYDDGLMDITLMRGNRRQMLKGLKEFRFDTLLKDKKENADVGLSYRRANFFRFIPLHDLNENDNIDMKNDIPSILNIDGERYNLEPFQIKVKQKCINVYSYKNKHYA